MEQSLDFSSNFYTWNYDSPIERKIGELLGKYVDFTHFDIIPQYEVHSSGGVFFLDYLVKGKKCKYAIECDGKDYHEYYADLYRDAWLLGENHINEMIRFTGRDLVRCPSVCMYFLHKTIPGLIKERSVHVIDTEARNERWNIQQKEDPDGEHFYDEIVWEEPSTQYACRGYGFGCCAEVIHRHTRFALDYHGEKIVQEWGEAFTYITERQIRSKDDFVSKYPHRFDGSNGW